MGTAPITFDGILLQQSLGVYLVYPKRMEFSIVSRGSIGVFEDAIKPALNFSSFDIHDLLRFKFLKSIGHHSNNESGGSRFAVIPYWGVAMTNFLDVTVNPNYENATPGISDFLGPELIGRIDINTNWSAPIMFHSEIAMMPIAAILRPGYSYIDNYTSTQPVIGALFSDFHVNMKPFAAISTDIGIDIITGEASRISFSYLWSYHSSGNSGQHRYDHATHLLAIDFFVKLRTHRK